MVCSVNEVSGKTHTIVRCGTLNSDRKTERQAEKTCPPHKRSKSNRSIDATVSFYGYTAVVKSSLIILDAEVAMC